MRKLELNSVVWKEGKYYIAQSLDVDVNTFGKTKKQAIAMLKDALKLYFAP
jgi:predicted RNase H-like HicB family nuclease